MEAAKINPAERRRFIERHIDFIAERCRKGRLVSGLNLYCIDKRRP